MADNIGTILLIVIPLFGAMFWVRRQLGKRIDDMKADTGKRIGDMKADTGRRIDDLKADTGRRIDDLKADMNRQFDETKADMNRQFDETKSRLQHIESRIDDTNRRIDVVARDVAELRDRTGALEGSLSTFMSERRNPNAA